MLITCKECNNEISNTAETCPHCGAPRAAYMGEQGNQTAGILRYARQYARWIVALIIILVLVVSKPTAADFEQRLQQDIMLALSQQEIKREDDILTGLFKLGCSLSRTECADLIRKQMIIETSDYLLATYARAHGKDNTRKCFGMLRNWWCWNSTRAPAE